jgi:diadenosine tetraphosphate (Ap4A) HIT family hydrolase
MSELPDCLYCRKDQRLQDLMIEIAPLQASTVYLFREQTHRGRCVVAYRAHVNELFELPDSELTLFMRDVARVAKAIKLGFGPNKINYGAYSDKLPHLHMHLVPKYEGGANWGAPFEMMPASKKLLPEAEYLSLSTTLKAQLGVS